LDINIIIYPKKDRERKKVGLSCLHVVLHCSTLSCYCLYFPRALYPFSTWVWSRIQTSVWQQ